MLNSIVYSTPRICLSFEYLSNCLGMYVHVLPFQFPPHTTALTCTISQICSNLDKEALFSNKTVFIVCFIRNTVPEGGSVCTLPSLICVGIYLMMRLCIFKQNRTETINLYYICTSLNYKQHVNTRHTIYTDNNTQNIYNTYLYNNITKQRMNCKYI